MCLYSREGIGSLGSGEWWRNWKDRKSASEPLLPPRASGGRGDKSWFTSRSFQKKLVLRPHCSHLQGSLLTRNIDSAIRWHLDSTVHWSCDSGQIRSLCLNFSTYKVETIVPTLLGYHEDLKSQYMWCDGTMFRVNAVICFVKKFCRMVWPSFLGTVSVCTVVLALL